MKRLLCIIALMFALVCMLTSCSNNEPTVSVNDGGFVVVNGVTTNIVVNKDDVILVTDDGYVVVNGIKTEYKAFMNVTTIIRLQKARRPPV